MVEWRCRPWTSYQGRFGLSRRNRPAVPRGCENEVGVTRHYHCRISFPSGFSYNQKLKVSLDDSTNHINLDSVIPTNSLWGRCSHASTRGYAGACDSNSNRIAGWSSEYVNT